MYLLQLIGIVQFFLPLRNGQVHVCMFNGREWRGGQGGLQLTHFKTARWGHHSEIERQ
jgi:hypothetical protein